MTLLYRLLSVIVNVMAVFMGLSLVFSIPAILASPLTLLFGFVMAATVLYAWFSYRFHRLVLQQQQPVKRSLRDWVRVNGIVTLLLGLYFIASAAVVLSMPELFVEQGKRMGIELKVSDAKKILIMLLAWGTVWVVHVLWTFALMKKFRNYFQE